MLAYPHARRELPQFQHRDVAGFEDEHRIGLVILAKEELVRVNGHERAQAKQKLENVGPDSCRKLACAAGVQSVPLALKYFRNSSVTMISCGLLAISTHWEAFVPLINERSSQRIDQ
jgi:hypothetical protein